VPLQLCLLLGQLRPPRGLLCLRQRLVNLALTVADDRRRTRVWRECLELCLTLSVSTCGVLLFQPLTVRPLFTQLLVQLGFTMGSRRVERRNVRWWLNDRIWGYLDLLLRGNNVQRLLSRTWAVHLLLHRHARESAGLPHR
jgi:hypothetical protein